MVPIRSSTSHQAHTSHGDRPRRSFAIAAYRATLDLRPQLTALYRALRELPAEPTPAALEAALRGPGRYQRPPVLCARLLTVLTELGLIELDLEAPSCRIVDAVQSDLELSPAYRAAKEELESSGAGTRGRASAGHFRRRDRLAAQA